MLLEVQNADFSKTPSSEENMAPLGELRCTKQPWLARLKYAEQR